MCVYIYVSIYMYMCVHFNRQMSINCCLRLSRIKKRVFICIMKWMYMLLLLNWHDNIWKVSTYAEGCSAKNERNAAYKTESFKETGSWLKPLWQLHNVWFQGIFTAILKKLPMPCCWVGRSRCHRHFNCCTFALLSRLPKIGKNRKKLWQL